MPTDLAIPIEQLQEPSDAMRYDMDDEKLSELITSIRRDGVLEPLLVIPVSSLSSEKGSDGSDGATPDSSPAPSQYEVRAGHRRLLACRQLMYSPIPCRVFTPDEPAYDGLMATENLIREDVTPFEEGCLFARIAEIPGITEDEMRAKCGTKSLNYIYDRIALVSGDKDVALAVHRRQISLGVAKLLNKIRYPTPGQVGEKLVGDALTNAMASADAYRAMFLERAILGGATIAVAESWVAQWRQSAGLVVTSAQPAIEPMPAEGYPLPQTTCALCGESDEPHKFETVSIHRHELAAIRAGMAAHAGNGQ
jgi:ParB-like chromosome segregation protein Spo0J